MQRWDQAGFQWGSVRELGSSYRDVSLSHTHQLGFYQWWDAKRAFSKRPQRFVPGFTGEGGPSNTQVPEYVVWVITSTLSGTPKATGRQNRRVSDELREHLPADKMQRSRQSCNF